MSEPKENNTEEERGEEEEDTLTKLEVEDRKKEGTAEVDREPGRDGEEAQVDGTSTGAEAGEAQVDLHKLAKQPGSRPAENAPSVKPGFLDYAEAQTDLPENVVQLQEPERRESIGNSTATVKVVLVPEGHVMTVAFAIGLSIEELKQHLATELRTPAELLQVFLDGRLVQEQQSLMELGVRPHGSTRMEMSSLDPTRYPLRPLRPPETDNMPDVITVRVQTVNDSFEDVVVEIERPRRSKAYLGGYRNRLTGVEYHHAGVQTAPKRRPDRGVPVFSRDTQTVELRSQVQQCAVHVSTQMTGIGCYVSCMNDKLVSPGNYIPADQYHSRRLKAVIRLQSYARRWLAQQEVDRLRRYRDRLLAWIEVQERRRKEEKEEQLRDRRRRWLNPERREDFHLWFQALESRRRDEEEQINSTLTGAERRAALCSLLEKETQLIAQIGRHRIAAQSINYNTAVQSFLDKAASPHRWRAADGRLLQMDTQHTIRAKELRELYNDANMAAVSQEQRLHVLMRLKHTVTEHKCPLSRDIIDLLDREVDLVTRGVRDAILEGLRRRISTLFLQFIRTPAFNPAASRLLKVPQDPSQLKNNVILCRACHRYLPSDDFSTTAGGRLSGRCRDCSGLDNIARTRNDLSCYKNILKRLREDEQKINPDARIPYLLQVEDVRFLVEVIWASQSALQGDNDLFNLLLVRWQRHSAWSPWNCILLSKEETSAHLEVEDIHKVYDSKFIHRIEHKHLLGRRHFSQISVMAEYLDSPPAAAVGNQLVAVPIAMATGKPTVDIKPSSPR